MHNIIIFAADWFVASSYFTLLFFTAAFFFDSMFLADCILFYFLCFLSCLSPVSFLCVYYVISLASFITWQTSMLHKCLLKNRAGVSVGITDAVITQFSRTNSVLLLRVRWKRWNWFPVCVLRELMVKCLLCDKWGLMVSDCVQFTQVSHSWPAVQSYANRGSHWLGARRRAPCDWLGAGLAAPAHRERKLFSSCKKKNRKMKKRRRNVWILCWCLIIFSSYFYF